MVTVVNQIPWMVNGKPLIVHRWDPDIGMTKVEPTKLPVWVKLTNVPMEAWTTKGISAISSSMGRPLIMDSMIAYVCKNGVGRTEYARVLLEIQASKGLKEIIELQYKDKNLKKSWEANREKERNKRLDEMEGLVEDVLEEECVAAKKLVADELNGASRSKIADEFVNHFEIFLGQATNMQHLDSLGNIFTKYLSDDEAAAKVTDMSNQEIKNALFGINDCKAPGLDGYAACFSKKPRILHPKVVTDSRPIACCNVLYKCISKILTNRIKGSLNKLVNLNQSAFIQGRNIHDNILLTHELLKGYNRKGGSKRCALNIDIAKAYDTVSWEFLRNVLIKFGFHLRMVDWIYTCISSLTISVCINGEIKGYFKGCKELKMTHMCFADDLLVICHGRMESVKVIKDYIDEFSRVSGLEPNINKSTIFFGNVKTGVQRSILNVMPFNVGKLLVKYLGVPLISKILDREECKQLIDKVRNKVDDWMNKSLTYAGRMQLITSVLNSMQVYWASLFLLPKSRVKDIERILKGFLWCQGDLARGKAKIAWKTVCKPKCKGGLGFKDLGKWNEVLLTKHVWNIAAHKESLWVKWVHIVKLKGKSFWEVIIESGDGKKIFAWYDKWNEVGPLCQYINNKDLYNARFDNKASIADVHVLSDCNDKVMWRCNNGVLKQFSTRQTWDDYRESYHDVNWKNLMWFSQCVPSHTFVLWMAVHRRLQTQDRVFKWNNHARMRCFFCKQCMDSHDHLFIQCNYAVEVWRTVKTKGYINGLEQSWQDTINSMASNHGNHIKSVRVVKDDTSWSIICIAKEARLAMSKGACFWASDAFSSLFLGSLCHRWLSRVAHSYVRIAFLAELRGSCSLLPHEYYVLCGTVELVLLAATCRLCFLRSDYGLFALGPFDCWAWANCSLYGPGLR
nr:hypothetical protein [Tanacetum cinerariifolium]